MKSWKLDGDKIKVELGGQALVLDRGQANWLFDSLGFALMELDVELESWGQALLIDSIQHHFDVG